MEPKAPALRAQSHSHWIIRGVPTFAIFFSSFAVVYAYTKTKKDLSKVQINVNFESLNNTCISTKEPLDESERGE